jgi:F0F1-type ATP synthase membrane subunit b/b'
MKLSKEIKEAIKEAEQKLKEAKEYIERVEEKLRDER